MVKMKKCITRESNMQNYLFKFNSKSQVDSGYKLSHVKALFELSGSYINVLHKFKFKVYNIYTRSFQKIDFNSQFSLESLKYFLNNFICN